MNDGKRGKAWDKAVRSELSDILKSEQFSDSGQLSRFLTFVVNKTLNNEQSDIKAYSIAVDALGRPEDFDPQNNATVRVAAKRLRQSLSLYYANNPEAGRDIRILLEPGSYIPTFFDYASRDKERDITSKLSEESRHTNSEIGAGKSKRENQAEIDENAQPKIAAAILLPDKNYPDWFKVGETIDSVSDSISRFDDYQFLGTVVDQQSSSDRRSSPDYTLLISIHRRENNVRIFGKLIRERDGTVIWSAQRLLSQLDSAIDGNIPQMVGRVFAPVGSPYGIICADLHKVRNSRPELLCYLLAYEYFVNKSDENYMAARACSERVLEAGSQLPSLHTLHTFLLLDEIREGRTTTNDDPLVAAQNTARKAVELGPLSARAHQALFGVRKVQGNFQAALTYGQRAMELNPYDTEIIGDFAAWQISTGDVEAGKIRLDGVRQVLDSPPAWMDVFQFLAAELSNDTLNAAKFSRLMDPSRSQMTAFCVAIGAFEQQDYQRAQTAVTILKEVLPEFACNPEVNLLKRGFSAEFARLLADKFLAIQKPHAK